MTDYKALAPLCIKTLVNRGIDFLVEEAKTFVKDESLHELSKNQIYGLRSEVDKGENFADLKARVTAWLNSQSEKKTGGKWKDIKNKLLNKMFEWDMPRVENVRKLAQKPFRKTEPIVRAINTLNLTENLRFELARSFFYAVLTFYRCYEDKEIREELEEMQL